MAQSSSTFDRPFASASWLYEPIPANPLVDRNSSVMVARLASGAAVANLHEFGIPFYRADASTPLKNVRCLMDWGICDLVRYSPRPLTSSMRPHTGSDHAMVVVDESGRRGSLRGRTLDEYWQYAWNGGRPQTSWGAVLDLDDAGRVGGATGAGLSRAAGVVRAYEIAAGRIAHALVFSTQFCQAGNSSFRFPASKTDGKYGGVGAVPEGTRIQLDPSLDPNAFGLSKGERAIFVALQQYGAYAMDCGGAAMAFSFEDIAGNPGNAYADAGLSWDYYGLYNIPWHRVRVLKSWNGQ